MLKGTTTPAPADRPAILIDRISFGYGASPVLRDVSLAAPAGRFLTLPGPSGGGKTTLLKLLGGYLPPAQGRVVVCGRDVTALPLEARNAAYATNSAGRCGHSNSKPGLRPSW